MERNLRTWAVSPRTWAAAAHNAISAVAILTRSVISMVTAEVAVEVSRVQRVDSQLVTKVSTGWPPNSTTGPENASATANLSRRSATCSPRRLSVLIRNDSPGT